MRTVALLHKNKSLLRPALFFLLLALILELTVFNAPHYEFIGSAYESFSLDIPLTDLRTEKDAETQQTILRFDVSRASGFPSKLRNLQIELADLPQDQLVTGSVQIDMSKDVHGQSQTFTIVPGLPASENFFVHPLQPVEGLSFELHNVEAQPIRLLFNQRVPLRFNFGRFAAVFFFLLFVYAVRPGSALYRYGLNLSCKWQKASLLALFLLQAGLMVFTTVSTYPDFGEALQAGNVVPGWNWNKRHYDFLTDALANHSLSLVVRTPPDCLETLDNPYDYYEREENGCPAYDSYLFDGAYYQGKYYIYYGVIPVLTLLLPYHLLTGKYLFLEFAMLFYALSATAALLYIYTHFVRKLFPNIRWLVYWLGAAILLNSSGVVWCLRRAQSYEFAFTSAFFFVTVGFAFNLSSLREDGGISRWRMALGCLLMACAVGCRPTSVLISLLNIPLFFPRFFGKNPLKKFRSRLIDMLCAALPYLMIAAVLMFYNYQRFGSVLEFGQYYQLSSIDNLAYKNNSNLSEYLLGVINLIFGPPAVVESSFPFLRAADPLTFGYDGAIVLVRVFSVARICPLLYLLWLIPCFGSRLGKKNPVYLTLCAMMIALSLGMAAMTAGIVGCHQRYILDFAWMIVLSALMLTFLIGDWFYERNAENVLHLGMLLCVLTSLACCLILSNGEENWFSKVNPLLYQRIARVFSFWL